MKSRIVRIITLTTRKITSVRSDRAIVIALSRLSDIAV